MVLSDENSISIYIERESKWIKIGTPNDSLEKLINNYLLEHEKEGRKLIFNLS